MPGYLRQLSREFVVFFRYGELVGAVLLILLYQITKALSIVSGSKKPPVRLTQVAFPSFFHPSANHAPKTRFQSRGARGGGPLPSPPSPPLSSLGGGLGGEGLTVVSAVVRQSQLFTDLGALGLPVLDDLSCLTTSSNCAIISIEYSLLCRRKSALHAVRPVTGPSYRGVILFISNGFLRLYQLWGYFAVSYRSTSKPTFSSTTL